MCPGQECSVCLWVFSNRLSSGVRNARKVTALFSTYKGSQVRHFQTPEKLLRKFRSWDTPVCKCFCGGERSLSLLYKSFAHTLRGMLVSSLWVVMAEKMAYWLFPSSLHYILPTYLFFWILFPAAASSWSFLGCCVLWSRAGTRAECSRGSSEASETLDFPGAGV